MSNQKPRTYLVKWDIKALEQLYSLFDYEFSEMVQSEVNNVLAINPYKKFKDIKLNLNNCVTNIKKLKGYWEGHWRIRFNEYRIIYKVIEDKVIVEVVKIGDRDEVYEFVED